MGLHRATSAPVSWGLYVVRGSVALLPRVQEVTLAERNRGIWYEGNLFIYSADRKCGTQDGGYLR